MANPNPRTDQLIATQFPPGVSGNPGGRPKKLTSLLEVALDSTDPKDPEKRKRAEVFVDSVLARGSEKSDRMAELVWDRIEGKVGNSVSVQHGFVADVAGAVDFQ